MTKHRWSDPSRDELRTERTCFNCGIIKVTRHDGGEDSFPWTEWLWPDRGEMAGVAGTPECTPPLARRDRHPAGKVSEKIASPAEADLDPPF